jgi:two-component system chemotaxis sensor kinase CheA
LNLEKYRSLFIEEATDHLAEMTRALAALERPEGREGVPAAIDTLFRMAHSIKGMAASLEYGAVSTLAHGLEDWLEPMRARGALGDEALPVLYLAVGALEQMVSAVAESGEAPPERADVLERLVPSTFLEGPRKKAPWALRRRRLPRTGSSARRSRRAPRCRASCASAPSSSTDSWPGSET